MAPLIEASVIDSDLHCEVPSIELLMLYLSDYWQEQIPYSAENPSEALESYAARR
jgi:hypothetical protein